MQTQVYSIDEIREIVAPIAKQHGVDKVFLFGSYARGDATPASDVDLCVDAPKLRGLFALGGLYADLEDALKKSIDVVTTGSLKYNKDKAFLENLPEVAAYYAVWNGLRDTLEGYYKNRPRQHNPLSQQKEFRAIKNAIIQEAERLRCQLEESSAQTSANPLLTDEHISSITSQFARLPSEYLLNSTVRLFHQMGQIFRDNAAPSSNPMGIRIDSKRRKKLMQKRLALGHKQDDHEQAQGYEQSL